MMPGEGRLWRLLPCPSFERSSLIHQGSHVNVSIRKDGRGFAWGSRLVELSRMTSPVLLRTGCLIMIDDFYNDVKEA